MAAAREWSPRANSLEEEGENYTRRKKGSERQVESEMERGGKGKRTSRTVHVYMYVLTYSTCLSSGWLVPLWLATSISSNLLPSVLLVGGHPP